MKVNFDGNIIKIRKDTGVVLVIDSGISPDFYEIVRNRVRDIDVPFKLGALSLDKEINEKEINHLSQMLRNRGKFITPLMEGFFQELPEKEYDLIVLHDKRVYDLDDYKADLESKFGKVFTWDINENQRLTEAEWRGCFESVISDFSIDSVELSFNSAVLCEWDDDFLVSLDVEKRQFVMKKNKSDKKKLDINLKTRGKAKEANIQVKVDGSAFSGRIKNDKSSLIPEWKTLSSDDVRHFKSHLGEYKKYNFNVECPLCRKKHNFDKPFFCSESKDKWDPLAEGAMILKGIGSCQKGFIFFHTDDNRVKYLTSEKAILEIEDLRFIFVSGEKVYKIVCEADSLAITEGNRIHSHLYELEKDEIVYLI